MKNNHFPQISMKPKSFVNLISTGYQLFVEIIKMLAKFQCHIKMNLMFHHQGKLRINEKSPIYRTPLWKGTQV